MDFGERRIDADLGCLSVEADFGVRRLPRDLRPRRWDFERRLRSGRDLEGDWRDGEEWYELGGGV